MQTSVLYFLVLAITFGTLTGANYVIPKPIEIVFGSVTGYEFARHNAISQGIDDINQNGTDSWRVRPGPAACSQVTCSSPNSAIYVCNDNNYEVNIYMMTIANYSAIINSIVNTRVSPPYLVLGQAYDAGGWNVIVGFRDGDVGC